MYVLVCRHTYYMSKFMPSCIDLHDYYCFDLVISTRRRRRVGKVNYENQSICYLVGWLFVFN